MITAEEYAELQQMWESLEFSGWQTDETIERQYDIREMMDSSPWALHPDTGEVITIEELKAI